MKRRLRLGRLLGLTLLLAGGVGACVWVAQAVMAPDRLLRTLQIVPHGRILRLHLSPDRKWLVSTGLEPGSGYVIRVWNTEDWREAHHWTGGREFSSFTEGGRGLVIVDLQGRKQVWSTATWKPQPPPLSNDATGNKRTVLVSPDRQWIAVKGTWSGPVTLWQARPRKRAGSIPHVFELDSYSPDSRALVYIIQSWGGGGGYYLADPRTGKTLLYAGGNTLAFTRDGSRVAGENANGTITLWDTRTWKVVKRIQTPLQGVHSLSFSENGDLLAAAANDGVQIYDLRTGWEVMRYSAGERPWRVSFVSQPAELVVASGGKAELWHVPSRELLLLRAAFRRLLR